MHIMCLEVKNQKRKYKALKYFYIINAKEVNRGKSVIL